MGLILYPIVNLIILADFYVEYFLDRRIIDGIINRRYYLAYLKRNLIKKESRFNRLYKKKGRSVPHFKVVVFMFYFLFSSFIVLLIPFIFWLFLGSEYFSLLCKIQDYIAYSFLAIVFLTIIEVFIENDIICKKITSKYTEEERRRIIKQIESEWENLSVTDYYLFEYYDKKFKEEKKQNKKGKKSDSNNDDSI